MADTSNIPRGILGTAVDALLTERSDLEAKNRDLYAVWLAADADLRPAEQRDRDDYAAQLRKPDGRDPGQLHSGVAQAALADAKRALDACETATRANERDLRAVLVDRQQELREMLAGLMDEARSEAAEHLSAAGVAVQRQTELDAVAAWIENPTRLSGESLRPFSVRAKVLDDVRNMGGQPMTADAVVAALASTVDAGKNNAALILVARRAGVDCTAIEQIDGKALRHRDVKITDLSKLGLSRIRVHRGDLVNGEAIDLVFAQGADVAELLADNVEAIDLAFANKTPTIFADEATEARVTGVVADLSEQPESRAMRVSSAAEARAMREGEARPTHSPEGALLV